MPKLSAKRLTSKDCESAHAKRGDGKRVELRDAEVRGLCLRVSAKGSHWAFRYRTPDGRQPRVVLGEWPGMKLEAAREAAQDALNLVRKGGDPQADKRRAAAEKKALRIRTWGDLATAYFDACEAGDYRPRRKVKKASTLKGERDLWRRHLKKPLGDLTLEETDRSIIRATLRKVKAAAPVQANRCHALLTATSNFAIWDGRLAISAMVGVDLPAAETPRTRTLADDELRALWATLSDNGTLSYERDGETVKVHVGRAIALALKLSLVTLQRRAEVAGMRVDELDLDAGEWVVRGGRGKNDATHLVPLSPLAVDLIREALALADDGDEQRSPFVFPSPRGKDRAVTPNALTQAVADAYRVAKVEGATLHDLRRTGATVMASGRLAIAPFTISKVLGHKSDAGGAAGVTARVYQHYDYAAEKRAALNAWAALLQSVVSGEAMPSNVRPLRL